MEARRLGNPKTSRPTTPANPAGPGFEPADWQEPHAPTEAVVVAIDHTRTRQAGRRRKADARMWEAMSARQEAAAEAIAAAVALITGEIGIRTQSFQRLGRGLSRPDETRANRQTLLIQRYQAWQQRASERDISVSDVLQILVHGESCHQQDRRNRRRNGSALAHLLDALELYAVLQGWG